MTAEISDRFRREAVIEQTQTLIGAPPNSTPSTSPLVRVGYSARAPVVARLMGRPVCPQLRNCRVRPSSYAWCQNRKSDPWQDAGFARVGAPGLATTGVSRLRLPWGGE